MGDDEEVKVHWRTWSQELRANRKANVREDRVREGGAEGSGEL